MSNAYYYMELAATIIRKAYARLRYHYKWIEASRIIFKSFTILGRMSVAKYSLLTEKITFILLRVHKY